MTDESEMSEGELLQYQKENILYTVYETASGKIIKTGMVRRDSLNLQAVEGQTAIEGGSHDVEHMVVDGVIVNRPALSIDKTEITADDVDIATISGLPYPVTVYIDGIGHEVTESTFELSATMPATYVIEINKWPYLPFRAEVTAS